MTTDSPSISDYLGREQTAQLVNDMRSCSFDDLINKILQSKPAKHAVHSILHVEIISNMYKTREVAQWQDENRFAPLAGDEICDTLLKRQYVCGN